jgi:FtsH-binding integral membrane protein
MSKRNFALMSCILVISFVGILWALISNQKLGSDTYRSPMYVALFLELVLFSIATVIFFRRRPQRGLVLFFLNGFSIFLLILIAFFATH